MEARVAVLEEIAASTKAALVRLEAGQDRLREDMHGGQNALRAELRSGQDALRIEMRGGQDALRTEMRTGLDAARDRHDRDFRITFGAIITMGLGLAALLAKGFKWI